MPSYLKSWVFKQAGTNLIDRIRFFGRRILLARLILHSKNGYPKPKYTSDLETSGNIVSFHFLCISRESFCNKDFLDSWSYLHVVWMSKASDFQKIFFILQTHSSLGVQKNILKTWTLLKINSTKNALIFIWRKFSEKIFLKSHLDRYFW